jgi:hypothetical protein
MMSKISRFLFGLSLISVSIFYAISPEPEPASVDNKDRPQSPKFHNRPFDYGSYDSDDDDIFGGLGSLNLNNSHGDAAVDCENNGCVSGSRPNLVVTDAKETQTPKPIYPEAVLTNISTRFKELIQNSNEVYGCFYNYTLYDVAQAMASKKGILIVNHHYRNDHCEALKHLIENGRSCYAHDPRPIPGRGYGDMHAKFCILDNGNERLLWHGSWNCTGNADTNNVEVVTVTNDSNVVGEFVKRYNDFMKHKGTKKIELADCTSVKKVNASGANRYAKQLNRIPDDKMEKA